MALRRSQRIGDYNVLYSLGTGTTGKVKLGEHYQTKKHVAIKIIKKGNFDKYPQLQAKVHREIALMRILDHPHLLKLVEVCESTRHLYIILEYAQHGELFDYLVARRTIELELALKFFRQIIYGLEFLHEHAICHRDLKPENILLDENDDIKIGDFGFARWMKANIAETSCGSPHYAAPEVIRGVPYDGRAADIWSCGVILFALVVGRLPFDDPAIRNLLAKVKCGQYIMPDNLPVSIQDLIARMLIVNPAERINIEMIKQHQAFRIGLPEGYIPPTPLPIPSIPNPIDPASIDQNVLTTLLQIGFADRQELFAEFAKEGHSMAKVFYSMLTTNLSLESLPWTTPIIEQHPSEAYMQSPNLGYGTSPDFTPDSYQYGSLSEISSYAEKALWANLPKNEYKHDVVQPCVGIPIPLEQVMTKLQSLLNSMHFQWFHPDDCSIFSRRPDDMMYLVIKCEKAQQSINMNLFFSQASQSAIQSILESVTYMLSAPSE